MVKRIQGDIMARTRTHKVPHRRRREGRTDYRLRLKLLHSGKPRLVVRKSSNNLTCQIIQHSHLGDKTLVSADSRELVELGWKAHRGNIPSAYLTGLLCGVRAKKERISEAVLDIGLYESTKGSRLYSALKGTLDAGVKISFSQDILPSEERVMGGKILEKDFETLRKRILKGK
jgi:large subunit ribosomal protein L18